ncbi:MAG: hypothetical protein B7Y25_02180 [Alphaproteobacteria bacterium 16-39-46]|nr:MAG: hypothetical protein B7Y25_02180 [Alphaproteobacteria bacterium 16-39-46]OZA43713.1 MAG: hypothetical protein B7X84_02430 [Alphaproteobacteria bacterium 17-39-52]HQS83635.1 hypothetical protein [Alphaproteobacteria bacterium]HQS93562.1 hypothetical protein [Alphaproteobacteria bacterium]
MRKNKNTETKTSIDDIIIVDREETDQKVKMILYLKRVLVFWICFSLFAQPLLAGNVLKRHTSLDDQELSLRTHLIPLQAHDDDSADHHEELGDQESSLGLHLLLEETQIGPQEEEIIPDERSQNRSSFSSVSFVFANYEPSLDSDELDPEKARLKAVENSWRNQIRWVYLSRLGHRSLYFLFLKHFVSPSEIENLELSPSDPTENSESSSSETLSASIVPHESSEPLDSSEENTQTLVSETDFQPESADAEEPSHPSFSHLWLHGRSFPLEGKDLKRVLVVNATLEGIETVLIEGVHTLFLALMVSQVFYSIKDHTDFAKVFDIIFSSADDNSIRDLYQIGTPIPHAQGLWALLAIPFAWGTFKGLKTYYHSEKEDFQEELEKLEHLPISFYHDTLRWFFPYLPYEHAFHVLTDTLLFEKEVLSEEKLNILRSLDAFSEKHGGRSRMFAYHTFYNVVDGTSVRNFSLLPTNTQEELLEEKALALHFLMKAGHRPHKAFFNFIPAFYARYLLWTLGQCEGVTENVAFLGLRTLKTAITVLLLKTIIEGILDILNCPQQQGQTWTGPADWASDYTYECFQEYMHVFCNPLPGQPVETLTSLFSQFHLPSVISMDLSGKSLNGTVIAQILNAFRADQPSITIVDLDVSRNNIGTLSSQDTFLFAGSLQGLSGLQRLNVSSNDIGYTDSNGPIALAKVLFYLTQIQTLDLSHNQIGWTDSNGTIALAEVLPHLKNLQTLSLSNCIGCTDSYGTIALAEVFPYMTGLQTLDLSCSYIGRMDSNGTIALAGALPYLKKLQTLNLWGNNIGTTDSEGIENLGIALSQMKGLKSIFLQQNPFYNTTFCQYYIPWISCPLYFKDDSSLDNYLSHLSNQTTSLNLGMALNSNSNMTLMMRVMSQNLPRFSYLKNLDLSNNGIEKTNSHGTVELSTALPYLIHLQTLDLSGNSIGLTDFNGTVALAEVLSYLMHLQTLDLSENAIGWWYSNGIIELAEALPHLMQLQTLNLLGNNIGYTDSYGTIALAKSLLHLTQLQILDLSGNLIGSTGPEGTAALLSTLSELTQYYSLTTLSLAGMNNVIWTQQENDFKVFIDRNLQEACESQLCHGGSVSQPTIRPKTRSLVSSDQIFSENTLSKEKLSRASKSSQKSHPQPEPEQPLDLLEEESFVTSSASSLQPPLVLTFIPHLLSKISYTVSDWWKKPSLPSLQEPLLEASSPSSPSSYSFGFRTSSQQSSFFAPREEFKLASFNACQAGEASSVGYNLCETQPPSFNACVVKPAIIAPSLDSVFLLGAFVWKAFISPERQEKIIDWTVPFPERLKSHIDHKLDRISDILQARSSKISPDTLKSYAWSLEDLNTIFAKHYDHATILLSNLTDFQDELDYLLLQLTRFEGTSDEHELEKKFYDGILGCYKDLKELPPLLSVLKEKFSEEDFEKYEKDFQRFVEILFDFEMKGKRPKTNKWMKRFKINLSTFTREINEEIGAI